MKRFILAILITVSSIEAHSQSLISATSAKLQVYCMKHDGSDAVMTSEDLQVSYNNLRMSGEVKVTSFSTNDPDLQALLNSTSISQIVFTTVIPEGQFAFRDTQNNLFSSEAEFTAGEHYSRIMFNFDVSNRNTSLANTFTITCTGSISLNQDLGITRDTGFDDKISFQFFQNVRAINY